MDPRTHLWCVANVANTSQVENSSADTTKLKANGPMAHRQTHFPAEDEVQVGTDSSAATGTFDRKWSGRMDERHVRRTPDRPKLVRNADWMREDIQL